MKSQINRVLSFRFQVKTINWFIRCLKPNQYKPEIKRFFITKTRKDENTKGRKHEKDKIIISCFPYFVFSWLVLFFAVKNNEFTTMVLKRFSQATRLRLRLRRARERSSNVVLFKRSAQLFQIINHQNKKGPQFWGPSTSYYSLIYY